MQRHTFFCGNALFLVLIGVALFAALAYTVTQNWRGGISTVSTQEQARLTADAMIGYGNGLRMPIDRMLQLGGVRDTNIWFPAAGAHAAYGTVGALPALEVFHPAGGTAHYQTPQVGTCLSACAYEFTGQYGITGVGTGTYQLVMAVINVDPLVCQKANDILNTGWTSVPAGDALTTLARFDGSAYGAPTAITLAGSFAGKRAFCYRESTGALRYIYLHVLRVR